MASNKKKNQTVISTEIMKADDTDNRSLLHCSNTHIQLYFTSESYGV